MPRRTAKWLTCLALALSASGWSGCDTIRTPGIESLQTPAARQSINPGINDPYLQPDVDPDVWAERFEVESREVFAAREAIADALQLSPGMRVADVGAGTGLFVPLLASRVGTSGRVYGVDIVPAFVAHIDRRARAAGLTQVRATLCSEDSVDLSAASVDLVFVCDTYHHFEYPSATLASIHAALVDGGELVVLDFERIPGVSSDWILGHVRAGREVFQSEIEAAGFELVEEISTVPLRENYMLRFRKLAS
ncbi:MAG: methyltransferase domain-containing protein [Planctomycetota bacterium]|nr:MAG: methyltransferase domain-containing protein [Planctomycetota bacterium]